MLQKTRNLGPKILKDIAIEDVLPYLNRKSLYRVSWGALKARGEKWVQIQQEFDKRLEQMLKDLQEKAWIQPKAGYGHWMASSSNNSILIHDPHAPAQIIAEFELPRQNKPNGLCLADYLPQSGSDQTDLLSFQVVTIGTEASEMINAQFTAGDYVEGYFSHGLAVQFAEATAEYVHNLIRQDLGIPKNRGRRYSWGYEPIPDLAQHEILYKLIPARTELGMDLTSAFQLIPEQSTAAMVIHHENARYFHIQTDRTVNE